MRNALIGGVALSVCLLLVCSHAGYPKGAWLFTLAASCGYVAIAVFSRAFSTWYGRLMLSALLCSAVGNVFGPNNAIAGVAAYGFAQLLLIAAFLAHRVRFKHVLAALPIVALLFAGFLYALYPEVSPREEKGAAIGYVILFSVMLAVAGGLIGKNRMIPLAASLFYLSGMLFLAWRYTELHPATVPLYTVLFYLAFTLLAVSINPRKA
jgi:hypothetical protein